MSSASLCALCGEFLPLGVFVPWWLGLLIGGGIAVNDYQNLYEAVEGCLSVPVHTPETTSRDRVMEIVV